jgi:hypothetical protein
MLPDIAMGHGTSQPGSSIRCDLCSAGSRQRRQIFAMGIEMCRTMPFPPVVLASGTGPAVGRRAGDCAPAVAPLQVSMTPTLTLGPLRSRSVATRLEQGWLFLGGMADQVEGRQ